MSMSTVSINSNSWVAQLCLRDVSHLPITPAYLAEVTAQTAECLARPARGLSLSSLETNVSHGARLVVCVKDVEMVKRRG